MLVIVLIAVGWLAVLVFVLALCRMAALGDAAQERLYAGSSTLTRPPATALEGLDVDDFEPEDATARGDQTRVRRIAGSA